MKLEVGTPVFQAKLDSIRYGVIEEKSKTVGGWQFYKVFWASEEPEDKHYRADKLKVLNLSKEYAKLNIAIDAAESLRRRKAGRDV